jgi:ABC-type bacteriocin/lantibiotic exporter with double-glycine peptidase domain
LKLENRSEQMNITQYPLSYWILNRQRLLQVVLLGVIIITIFISLVPVEFQKRIVNVAIRLKNLDVLFSYCAIYFNAVLITSLLKYLVNMLQTYVGQRTIAEMRGKLYEQLLHLPLESFRYSSPGAAITSLTSELNPVGQFLGGAVAIPISSVLTILAFSGYMFYLHPVLALICLAIVPIEMIIVPVVQREYNRLNSKRIARVRSLSDNISEAIYGIHEIRGNSSFGLETKKFKKLIKKHYSTIITMFYLKYAIKFVNNLFQHVGPFLLFLCGGYFAIKGQITIGAFLAFYASFQKLYDPCKEMIEYYQLYQDARIRYQKVMEYFDVVPKLDVINAKQSHHSLSGHIEVSKLSYLVQKNTQLLNQISFSIAPGEHVAMVGTSGSGKSTLAMIIGQLYPYDKGNIKFDGYELSRLSKPEFSRQVSFITQNPYIFVGSIRSNLLYGCESLIHSENNGRKYSIPKKSTLLKTIQQVGLEDDIFRLGMNSVLDEHAIKANELNFIRIRQILHAKLGKKLSHFVEIFNVNRFLHYKSIGENIVFADVHNPEYSLKNILNSHTFQKFLTETNLDSVLLRLGKSLLQKSQFVSQKYSDKDGVVQSLLESDEMDEFRLRLYRLNLRKKRLRKQDKKLILSLALRYIPGKHRFVSIPSSFQKQIVQARHQFIKQIGRTDMRVQNYLNEIVKRGAFESNHIVNKNKDFSFYLPTQYIPSQTLMENIFFGTPKKEFNTVIAQAHGVIKKILAQNNLIDEVINAGLDFEVGSKGDPLSGGQKQKIALARALLKEPTILIMDEATASMDNASQSRVQQFVRQKLMGKSTVLSVIHRLDLLPYYDKIIVLDDGCIKEMGSYSELMFKKGRLYNLYSTMIGAENFKRDVTEQERE